MCHYWQLKYSLVHGFTTGTIPSAYKTAWNNAALNCNYVVAQGFKIKHPTNELYISSKYVGDVIEGAAASRSVLSSTPELFI
jgi:hypothetical protein